MHARLAPSNESWPFCPGQPRVAAQYPDIPGEAAIDGTGSHILLEMCVINNTKADYYKGSTLGVGHEDQPKGWHIDTQRINRVNMVINYIDRRKSELAARFIGYTIQVLAESKSDPGKFSGRNDWSGTADVTISVIDPRTNQAIFIELVDLKDGIIPVNIRKHGRLNTQLISYLSGKVLENKLRNAENRITIVQPKGRPPIKYEDIGTEQLIQEYAFLNERASATDDPEAPLIADDKNGKGYCKWCPHKPNCKALSNKLKGILEEMTNNITSPLFATISGMFGDIESMSNDTLEDFVDCKAPLMDLFKRADEEIERRISTGHVFNRHCMKPGNSEKIWNVPEEEIYKMLKNKKLKKEEIYIPKFVSVAQVLKHSKLTQKQRDDIQKTYVNIVPGTMKLGKKTGEDEDSTASILKEIQQDILKDTQKAKFSFL
jgi:hypothetical protein